MRKRIGISLMVCGVLLILSALLLIGFNRYQDAQSAEHAQRAEAAVEAEIGQETRPAPVEAAEPKVLRAEVLEGYPYIGTLSFPTLETDLPVMEDWSKERLHLAPCREYGTTAVDMVIAGHNYRSQFGKLKQLLPGDPVTFTDMDGEKTVYEVELMEAIRPTEVDRVLDPAWDLVLYTCTYGGRARLMVGCRALSPAELS